MQGLLAIDLSLLELADLRSQSVSLKGKVPMEVVSEGVWPHGDR